ncbi:MAG TPA: hypothetical protein IGS40_24400 [Trichormus sp. M33_DOE_039]|nr:hypothetical protein [Trichormus sp. M33_DOE_039]
MVSRDGITLLRKAALTSIYASVQESLVLILIVFDLCLLSVALMGSPVAPLRESKLHGGNPLRCGTRHERGASRNEDHAGLLLTLEF